MTDTRCSTGTETPFAWFKTDVNGYPVSFVYTAFDAEVLTQRGFILTPVYTLPDRGHVTAAQTERPCGDATTCVCEIVGRTTCAQPLPAGDKGEADWYRWRCRVGELNAGRWSKWTAIEPESIEAFRELNEYGLSRKTIEIEPLFAAPQPASNAGGEVKRVTDASNEVEEAACLIWAELCPGMVMGDSDLPHYEAAAKAVLGLRGLAYTAKEPSKSAIPFVFNYENYRGEVSMRVVTPIGVRFGSTNWHPSPQWLLLAFDHERQAEREFAMADMGATVVSSTQRGCGDPGCTDPNCEYGK